MKKNDSIALIGGGPAALFVFKHVLSENKYPQNIFIFEKNSRLGAGMPYSTCGSNKEHVANVSANELPDLYESFSDYLQRKHIHDYPGFMISRKFNEYQVIPRLLLGDYLEEQFRNYINKAIRAGIKVIVCTETKVLNIIKKADQEEFSIITDRENTVVGKVIICTGHHWPKRHEEIVKGWYDSPYPPSKFTGQTDFPVAIRGTSLTAVDAVKTLARLNGEFVSKNDKLEFKIDEKSKNFSLTLFSRNSYLPALRFHSEGSSYSEGWIMSPDEIYEYKERHQGFVDLEYVYDRHFKQPLRQRNENFYHKIKDLTIEQFVEKMLSIREELDSFELFKAEYNEARKSISRHESIAWKEVLSAFSYAINYPAKHFSAEDMLRLKKTLHPLISVIIASLPQDSYKEIIALYNAGIIQLVSVGDESHIEPHDDEGGIFHYQDKEGNEKSEHYKLYIDAIGQQPVQFNDFPFQGLRDGGYISSGYLRFNDNRTGYSEYRKNSTDILNLSPENYYLRVDGLNINDNFQALDHYGKATENLFIMSVPLIAGLNPDYSGLDFCDTAGRRVAKAI